MKNHSKASPKHTSFLCSHISKVQTSKRKRKKMKTFPLLCICISLLVFLLSLATTTRAGFTCNSKATATCQSLAGYIPANATTLGALQSLFQVQLPSLLGANNLPPTTPSSHQIPANNTVLIPFPCRCSNGTGVSDHLPFYTVKPTDQGLYAIATTAFDGLVQYQDIARVNNISDVNYLIRVGQKLWIPLPCSCDAVKGEETVHLAHIVAKGSSVEAIAEEFGTEGEVILKLNRISDPKTLEAGQVLDVPLKACASSISSTSLDHNLLLSNNTYAITAENCIQCSCSSSSYQLSCHPIQGLSESNSKCPVSMCGKLFIGNSTSDGCNRTTCAYEGYTNSTGLKILSNLVNQPTCNSGNGPAAQPAGNPAPPAGNPAPSAAGRLRLGGYQIELLLLLQVALVWFSF